LATVNQKKKKKRGELAPSKKTEKLLENTKKVYGQNPIH